MIVSMHANLLSVHILKLLSQIFFTTNNICGLFIDAGLFIVAPPNFQLHLHNFLHNHFSFFIKVTSKFSRTSFSEFSYYNFQNKIFIIQFFLTRFQNPVNFRTNFLKQEIFFKMSFSKQVFQNKLSRIYEMHSITEFQNKIFGRNFSKHI